MDIEQIARWPGKSPAAEESPAHPAAYHMLDVAAVAEILLAGHPRRDLYCLLIALHDLGKVGNVFRDMLLHGSGQGRRHWEVTEAWLHEPEIQRRLLQHLAGQHHALNPLAAAIAGHPGKPPTARPDPDFSIMRRSAGTQAQEDALAFVQACLDLWPAARLDGLRQREAMCLTWYLAGVTTVADWVGSNPEWCPAAHPTRTLPEHLAVARQAAPRALEAAGLLPPRPNGGPLFTFDLRPMQKAARPKDRCLR